MKWELHLRLLGVYRWQLDGALRWNHRKASAFAQRCLAEFGGRSWSELAKKGLEQKDDATPLARLAGWDIAFGYSIKDLPAEEAAENIATVVRDTVLPFVASIGDDRSLLHLLTRNGPPVEWLYSQPLFRFAEAAFLVEKLGASGTELGAQLEVERNFMRHQLVGVELETYVLEVRAAAAAAV